MLSINRIVLPSIESRISASFIVKVFEECDIAKLGKITFNYNNDRRYKRAIIEVNEWCDCEQAWKFISRLRCSKDGIRIYCDVNRYWIVKLPKSEHWIKQVERNYSKYLNSVDELHKRFCVKFVKKENVKTIECAKCDKYVSQYEAVYMCPEHMFCKSCFTEEAKDACISQRNLCCVCEPYDDDDLYDSDIFSTLVCLGYVSGYPQNKICRKVIAYVACSC